MDYNLAGTLWAVCLFILAGVFEIGGGWFVWKWRREGWNWSFSLLGTAFLFLYAMVPTFQAQPFGRTYAAYGGFFIALSLFWAWAFDSSVPDRWDLIGSLVAVAGVCMVMFAPRGSHMG